MIDFPELPRFMVMIAMSCAVTIAYVRVVATISRWTALGPGRAATRAIVGTFLLSLSYALVVAMRFPFVGGPLTLDDMAWIALPIAFQLTGWTVAAAMGERDVVGYRPVERRPFGLRDALLALALFGVAAAALRFAIGPGGVHLSSDIYFTDVLYWGPIVSLLLLILFCLDAAIRTSFARERQSPTRWGQSDLDALKGIGTLGLAALTILLLRDGALVFIGPILGVVAACYAGASVAQEAFVRALGLRATNLRTMNEPPPKDEAGEQTPT